jgi:hypothetical protein
MDIDFDPADLDRLMLERFHLTPALIADAATLGLDTLRAEFLCYLALGLHIREHHGIPICIDSSTRLQDDVLRLLQAGGRHELQNFDDLRLRDCWDLRWTFQPDAPLHRAHFRPGPSYNDRLRMELLLNIWERSPLRSDEDPDATDVIARSLRETAARFGHFLKPELLRDAAEERRAETRAWSDLHSRMRTQVERLPHDSLAYLALTEAIDGGCDLPLAVARHGSGEMRDILRPRLAPPVTQRQALEPALRQLRRRIWSVQLPTSTLAGTLVPPVRIRLH